jgi:hypothetical protein
VALSAGCAGYKLGPTNGITAGSRSVAVRPFINHSYDPRVTEYLAISFRKQFIQDGTYRLETGDGGDIIVRGEIMRLDRTPLAYQTNDVLTPQQYTLILSARVIAIEATTGKTNLNQIVQGRTYIPVGNDEFSSERQAIPLLTDDLARRAVGLLVDGTW